LKENPDSFSKADFISSGKPKDFEFEINGVKPNPTTCAWMPTDNNLFAVGFDSGHIAFFNHVTGKLEDHHQVSEHSIISMVAHQYQSHVAFGDVNGKVWVYDLKGKQVIGETVLAEG